MKLSDYKLFKVTFHVDGEDLETLNNICTLWNDLYRDKKLTEDQIFDYAMTLGIGVFITKQLKFVEKNLRGQYGFNALEDKDRKEDIS